MIPYILWNKTKYLQKFSRQNNVIKVVLFDSASKGSLTNKSDLDLMIIIETPKRFFDRYEEFDEIYARMKNRGKTFQALKIDI